MSPFLIAFLVMLAIAIVVIAVSGISLLLRLLAVQRAVKALQQHPTVVALRQAEAAAQLMREMQAKIATIHQRGARIAEASASLAATSALYRLDVDRMSFATKLLLATIVPTLRGSMADED